MSTVAFLPHPAPMAGQGSCHPVAAHLSILFVPVLSCKGDVYGPGYSKELPRQSSGCPLCPLPTFTSILTILYEVPLTHGQGKELKLREVGSFAKGP